MEIRIVNSVQDFFSLKTEWEKLQLESDHITFYNTFFFQYNWWKDHDANNELFIICIYEQNELIGLAPLMQVTNKAFFIKYSELNFIGRADFFNFLIRSNSNKRSVVNKIFNAIDENCKWDKLKLTHMTKGSELLKYLLQSDEYNSSTRFFSENPIITVGKYKDFDEFEGLFFKKKVKQYKNKLLREHKVDIKFIHGNPDGLLRKIKEVHVRRNTSDVSRSSLYLNDNTFRFLEGLYALSENCLTLVLESNNEIIAYITAYCYNGTLHNWNMAFNLNYQKYSPGDLVYYFMIQYVFENKSKYSIVDFGGGRYAWKFKMTDEFISLYQLNVNNKKSRVRRILNVYDKIFRIGKILLRES